MDDSSIGPGGVRGGPSFRTMSKQDYLLLYDGIHTLLKERKIGKEQENELYELIGQQDKRLAAAYVQYKDTGQVSAPFNRACKLRMPILYRFLSLVAGVCDSITICCCLVRLHLCGTAHARRCQLHAMRTCTCMYHVYSPESE